MCLERGAWEYGVSASCPGDSQGIGLVDLDFCLVVVGRYLTNDDDDDD